MEHGRDLIEEHLETEAQQVSPPTFAVGDLVRRIRRRRRFAVGSTAVAAVTVVALSATAATHWFSSGGGSLPAGDDSSGQAYRCGETFVQPSYAVSSRNGLSLAIRSTRRTADNAGPAVEVALAGDRQMAVMSTPPNLIEVLYLKNSVIVGGGPMLAAAGDHGTQGIDRLGYGAQLTPDRPSVQNLGPRDRLCPPLRWSQVWSAPQDFEVVIVLEQPAELDIQPAPDVQLLIARAPLSH